MPGQTGLSAPGCVPQTAATPPCNWGANPSNGRWITVSGGGAEFIEKPIASGMLGSAETSNNHGGFGGPLCAEPYGDEVQPIVKRLLEDSDDDKSAAFILARN